MNFVRGLSVWSLTGITCAAIALPAQANDTTITEVQFVPTQTGIRFEFLTEGGTANAPVVREVDNAVILEFPQTQLQGAPFYLEQPTPGIISISVEAAEEGIVRAIVLGETGVPAVEYRPSPSGFALDVAESGEIAGTVEMPEDPAESPRDVPPEILEDDIIEIVVTATRTEESPLDIPRSVTIITRDQIEAQTRVTRDLGSILSNLVPGFAPATGTTSLFGQSLRGRNPSILIDGVPQSTSRNVLRDLQTIDPNAIERIEVLRGPTAVYGDGATGGVINIITRAPEDEPFTATTRGGFRAFPTNIEDSIGGEFAQTFSGRQNNFEYTVSASFAWTEDFFDGEGNRIPPDPNGQGGLADTDTFNLLSKFGGDLDENQRLEVSLNHFNSTQFTDWTTDPSIRDEPGRQRAEAIEGIDLEDPQESRNTFLNFSYSHDDVLDGTLAAQFYYRDYFTRFFPFDGRAFPSLGNSIIQSYVDSEKWGGRLQWNVPVDEGDRLDVLIGADYANELTSQRVGIQDPDVFDDSDGRRYETIEDRVWSPPLDQQNLGLFAQVNWEPVDDVIFLGGLRYEAIDLEVDDYTTLSGNDIGGGELDYSEVLFNAGLTVYVADNTSVFANFSQGFSLADVGLVLRNAPAGFSVEELDPEAQKVNHYELGIRGDWDNIQGSLVGFFNESELGTSFTAPGEVVRAPERVWGLEATVDWQPSDRWMLGSSVSWSEGEVDVDDDGDYKPLSGFRIAPVKVTAYVENQTLPRWRNRLQALFVGSRDAFGNDAPFGQRDVDSYITLDWVSTVDVGPGTFELGIQNLLDTDYFPVVSQLQPSETSYTAGRGRTVWLGYSVEW